MVEPLKRHVVCALLAVIDQLVDASQVNVRSALHTRGVSCLNSTSSLRPLACRRHECGRAQYHAWNQKLVDIVVNHDHDLMHCLFLLCYRLPTLQIRLPVRPSLFRQKWCRFSKRTSRME
ncbi:uncharacterized protein EDB93DRAFT_1135121 [Suillus bovinus]|uniref:uncharacterized protein n=1 Tax=Suillus bovinus TaxID=48563 RepID=UPI001B86D1AD|nr:uncharacterized protein EDB93DRAFT_1135121 [Suillus bovinus]KAG2153471.1 hypothetical protein EDB93DRAFT_1135121 [Suillus bovinus]